METEKGIVILQYNNQTLYTEYLEALDMAFSAYSDLRDKKSIEMYDIPYNELGMKQQEIIQKIYPIMIVQKNKDVK